MTTDRHRKMLEDECGVTAESLARKLCEFQLDDINEVLVDEDGERVQVAEAETFADACLLTRDAGVVLRLSDGSEFQLTIVKSR